MIHNSHGMSTLMLALVFVSSLFVAQGQPVYGSKVLPYESDESQSVSPFYAGPIVAFVDAGIVGVFDPGDPVYLNIDPNDNLVSENDVRLTPFRELPAGSQVRIGDPDHGYKLIRFGTSGFPAAELRYFDVDGDKAYSLEDPVYLDLNPGLVNAGDIRITSYLTYTAGGRVRDSEVDSDKNTIILPGMFSFYNANGNVNNGGWAIYDVGDRVYMDTQYPFYKVTINDIRMTM